MTIEERRKAAEWFRNRAKNCPMPGARRMYEIATEAMEERERNAQPPWIPCSERLPEKKQSLLVTVADEVSPYTSDDEWTGTGFWAYGKRVSAWMPLPKPYGGESK